MMEVPGWWVVGMEKEAEDKDEMQPVGEKGEEDGEQGEGISPWMRGLVCPCLASFVVHHP